MKLRSRPFCLIAAAMLALLVPPAHGQRMPREDVVDVPAIGEGLSVSNVFQSNMVLQREKGRRTTAWGQLKS